MAAVLMLVTGLTAFPVLAEEAVNLEMIPSKPGVTELVGRILQDPHRDYSRVHGPDDCNSETLYTDTKELLGNYVADPTGQTASLRDYIISGKEQCNCTRAIVGKYFDTLVEEAALTMSELPCF